MRKMKGIRLGRRLVRVFRRLKPPSSVVAGAVSKLGRLMKQGASCLRLKRGDPGYIRVGQDPAEPQKVRVPKGHLAVYVGEREDFARRVTVPVIYFNHPLFVNLLREAETVFGFDHPGGIQIPCRISEFESVQVAIKNRRRRGRGGED
ncbi:PREDICTED: auxin-responsive protein SAUR36-like [Ipomoea nil]|uniref:auxin-responsive protein SAUR36-like n=1 Tax=Ipomoea nil TaxID=35883 RepID=UPI0009009117|nr:PREDICTED: auxin-responsive protein SAUR36-like [Ipomoea nil]